ncbi:fumarylacetoacetate hydrolase family protein [Bacillus tianshenii]|uniref:fumarylacetoacetate hydrolase family protein n=1 Tax=Sutcliffiella tianshenii TaxID=1463404 RepID=UPI001CD7D049|nr:fumarylacetoacetate hydrolase family protein [Bacillus tianshenii]MCA1319549.1 fumarylacetoacetate hydrolase family protein [Bacillus tianshenii]
MKYISFTLANGEQRAGWLDGDFAVDMHMASGGILPKDMLTFIEHHESLAEKVKETAQSQITQGRYPLNDVELLSPLPRPVSVRDFYAFLEHVKTARAKRGLEVIPEWYEIPVFYFTNHLAIKGPNEQIEKPEQSEWLDYELEIACIIGKQGKNIRAEDAESHIFGYCIMNDWSARDLQAKEMKVGLGPAKGKDFATSLGPVIVTKDELEIYKKDDRYDLAMTASVNGRQLSYGNFNQIHYTFAEMIERASAGVTLYPGEVIGSGTVGTGCILELGTDVHPWLKSGDSVELSITGLGKLVNSIK